MTNNIWLKLVKARKIAADLQRKYFGSSYRDDAGDPIEVDMLRELWSHDGEMYLETHWDDDECLLWVQIGVGGHLVPR